MSQNAQWCSYMLELNIEMDIVNRAAQNTSQTVQKILEDSFFPHLLLFLVCQGIQKYIHMDLLMTERLRGWLHISDPKIVLSTPNTLVKAEALCCVCVCVCVCAWCLKPK